MDITGKIIQVLPLQSGTSQAGNQWKKQEYVLETEENYPKKVCFDFFGDAIDQNPISLNDKIRLYFDIESREYNGRWYTNIRGWKTEKLDAQAPQQMEQAGTIPTPPAPDFLSESSSDDLPF